MCEWSQDSSKLLHGEAVFFPDFPPVDDVWHNGKILSAVYIAGSTEWFNVAYDGESDVLTLNLTWIL